MKKEEKQAEKVNLQEDKKETQEQTLQQPKIEGKSDKKKELWRAVKFLLFSISAGVIQFGLTAILELIGLTGNLHWIAYGIGLVASVIWNFTFNRKFTFKSANNIPIAMLLVACYYAVFTPLSVWGDKELVATCGWPGLASTAFFMIINFVTEFLYDRFVVFRKSIDTNIKKKEKNVKEEAPNAEENTTNENK